MLEVHSDWLIGHSLIVSVKFSSRYYQRLRGSALCFADLKGKMKSLKFEDRLLTRGLALNIFFPV